MDDPRVVGRGERARDVGEPRDAPRDRDARVPDVGAERVTAHELHDDVRRAAERLRLLQLADVVHRDDARVREPRGGTCLAQEARAPLGLHVAVDADHLDRDVAPEARIARAVHLAHPAGAQALEDLVALDAIAGGERHQKLPRHTNDAPDVVGATATRDAPRSVK